jgi:hypothetical protein
VSRELLWLWDGSSSGTQEGERPPLEASTRGLVKGQQTKKTQFVCSELSIAVNCELIDNCKQCVQ